MTKAMTEMLEGAGARARILILLWIINPFPIWEIKGTCQGYPRSSARRRREKTNQLCLYQHR